MKTSKTSRSESGFTVLEIAIVMIVLVVLTVFFVIQRNSLEVSAHDAARKTAINAFYYDLKEVFYEKNHYYPQTISRDNLKEIDPNLFTDPDNLTLSGDKCVNNSTGQTLDTSFCNYHYSTSKCDSDGHCQAFKISADMETEATYSKSVD